MFLFCFALGTHLSERRGVKSVLASNLKADRVASLGVPGGLSTSLNLRVHAVVVAGGENFQVVTCRDRSRVLRDSVANGCGVLGDGSLLDVIATLSTDEEALVSKNSIEVGSRATQKVDKGTSVQVRLLEVETELGTLGTLSREILSEDLGFETLGDVVVKFELGVESVGSAPRLGESEAWKWTNN